MSEILSKFAKINEERLDVLRDYKAKSGRKIVGFFCSQCPEELMYASGMLPIRILGSMDPLKMVDGVLQTYVCSFARSCVDLMLLGKYDFLDGVVVPHSCDTIRGLFGIIEQNVKLGFYHFLRYPITIHKPEASPLIEAEYAALKETLEKHTGNKITNEKLAEAIAIYNKNRDLIKELAEYRRGEDRRISGKEFMDVVLAGFVMDKKDHNEMLEQLLVEVKAKKPEITNKPNILIVGNVLDNSGIFGIIEEAGANIVHDDLCSGLRYFNGRVDERIEPMKAILKHYLARTFCPCKGEMERRLIYLKDKAKRYNAQGVILLHQKFCDPHFWDAKYVKEEIEKMGIPVIILEFEQFAGGEGTAGGMKTRVQSLVEMIGGK